MTNHPKEQSGIVDGQDNPQETNDVQMPEGQSVKEDNTDQTSTDIVPENPENDSIAPENVIASDDINIEKSSSEVEDEEPLADLPDETGNGMPENPEITDAVQDTTEAAEDISSDIPEDTSAKEEEEEEEEVQEILDNTQEKEVEVIDYSEYDREKMVERLRKLVDHGEVDAIKDEIDTIKFHFYKKLKAENDLKRKDYVENGGKEDDFVYEEDAQELILKSLLNKYREMRNVQREQLEVEKQQNLEEKLKIIEELKELTNSSDSIGDNFQSFRDLQNRWRTIGLVPQSEVKNLWETYHHYVEVFYDYIKINKELRDLDFKRNLEAKINLCEKAEALMLDDSVINAFHVLQTLHDQWREIGPVPKEMRTEIWERFKAASSQINKKHQEHFENQKELQQKNLEAKEALIEKVEEIAQRPMTTMSQWEKNSKEIIEIQKLWNTIGYTSKKDNSKLYKRFHASCDDFFNRKREFFGNEKVEQENNLQLKEDLCVQAEALKDSTEWKSATEDMINLQKKWKEIGSVPAKYRESIWKRFRSACDYFFEQKAKHFSSVDSEYENNLKAKQDLIKRIQDFAHSNDAEKNFEQLKEFQREWSEIGFVPIKYKKKIQEEYRNAVNKQFDSLKLDKKDRNLLMYKNKIENLKTTSQSRGKLDSERDKMVRKYQQLQNDLIVWENNIGFFSKSKNSEAMIANVERMIEQGRIDMKELEEKIRLIDNLDDNN
ncbi:MAG: DUF349 domain-containing protein [Bacteroidales bacterium]|jgi:hypothetical protein|nr:DUF349 domain-containing protein [Bacteroidales bacterium]